MILKNYDDFAEGLNESIHLIGMCKVNLKYLQSNTHNDDKLLINIYTLFSIFRKQQIDTTKYTLERIKANLLNYMKLLNNISLILLLNEKYDILFKIIEYANIFLNIHEILNNTTNKTYEFKIKSYISKYKKLVNIDKIYLLDFILYINEPLYKLIYNKDRNFTINVLDILLKKSTDEAEKEKIIIFIKKEICSILMEEYIEKSNPRQYIQLTEQRICSVLMEDYEDINIYSYEHKEYFEKNNDANDNVIDIIKKLKEKFNENLYESIKKINDNTDNIIKEDKIEMLMNVLDNIEHNIDRNHTIPFIYTYILIIVNINIYLYFLKEYDNLIINLEFYNLLNFIHNIRVNNIETFISIDFQKIPVVKVYTNKKEFNSYLFTLSNKEISFSFFDINSIKKQIENFINKLEVLSPSPSPAAPSPAAAPPVPEHRKIHEISTMQDVINLYNNKNILIIKYGAGGGVFKCDDCERMDEPFGLLAIENTYTNYRYCKFTFNQNMYNKNNNVYDTLIEGGIIEKNVAYPFIKIYKDNLLYIIKAPDNQTDTVSHYMDELKKLLKSNFSDLKELTASPVPPAPAQAQAPAPAPAEAEAPKQAAAALPAPPAPPAQAELYDNRIVYDISSGRKLLEVIKKFLVVIINFHDNLKASEELNLKYNRKANENTDNNIIFISVNVVSVNDSDFKQFIINDLHINKYPTIYIYYKHMITEPVLMLKDNIETELTTILSKLKYNLNNVNHIFSMEMLKSFFNDFEIVIVKYTDGSGTCGLCNNLKPIYETIAINNTNDRYIYTEIDIKYIYPDDLLHFMQANNIQSTPTVVIYKEGNDIHRFIGLSAWVLETYMKSLDSEKRISGGNNKYKKTDKQITVIYKKKEYTRVIYICERKKYVKINKTFMLLSKLKKI